MTNCLLSRIEIRSDCFRSSQNGAGGRPSDIDGKGEGELAGGSESLALQFPRYGKGDHKKTAGALSSERALAGLRRRRSLL